MFIVLSPVSNEVPEHPCVSPVSNQVFERRLIEKYIAENGVDPINGQPLSEEQLIDIKGTAAQITLFLSEVQMLYGHFKMHPFLYFQCLTPFDRRLPLPLVFPRSSNLCRMSG